MRVSILVIPLVALLVLFSAAPSWAAEKGKPQTVCPVTGNPINKAVYVDHDGKRIYFCCANCLEKFKADPAGYIKKLEDQGVVLEKAPNPQTLCPVTGNPINKAVYVDHDGKRIYFCCADCIKQFKTDPEAYIKKLEDQGITLAKTQDLNRLYRGASEGEKHEGEL